MKKGQIKHNQKKKTRLPGREEQKIRSTSAKKIIRKGETTEYHNFYLRNDKLGLRGIIDRLALLSEEEAMPINIKTGGHAKKITLPLNYKAQLVAEALLIENTTHYRVSTAAIQPETGPLRLIEINPEDKLWILRQLRQMKKIIQTEIPPSPTPYPAKCVDCEYFPACKHT